jgi:hypothetical protein
MINIGDTDVSEEDTLSLGRLRLKCDGTRAETRFSLSAKRTSPFKSAGASVQSTTGSRGVCISGSNAVYTTLRDSVKSTGYPLHSPVSPSLPLPCVTVSHHISPGLYTRKRTLPWKDDTIFPAYVVPSRNRSRSTFHCYSQHATSPMLHAGKVR